MLHGGGDLDAGRKAVEDQTADLALDDRDQIAIGFQIRRCSLECRREMAVKFAGKLF